MEPTDPADELRDYDELASIDSQEELNAIQSVRDSNLLDESNIESETNRNHRIAKNRANNSPPKRKLPDVNISKLPG